jgi:APA family basic amino acid/polyamine antiporter
VFTLVGYVIGASIFILPGQLAAEAGPGSVVAYLAAGVLAAVACVAGATVGSAVPVSGAGNVASARVLAPICGFLGVWLTLIAVGVSIALVGFGLADYLAYFIPGVNQLAVALGAAVLFGLLNLSTVRLAVWIQVVMTAGFLVVMYGFGLGGAAHARPDLLHPLFPNGLGPVVTASVLAYFSYAGITVITEIGGEIKNPSRTLPLALLIGFLVVLSAYGLVAFAVPALLPWQSLGGLGAPVARAAEVFLPQWVGGAIAVAAILAAATSINGMILIHSRDVLAMARTRVFPKVFARRDRATQVPRQAVLLVVIFAVACILLGGTIRQYAMMAVVSVMVLQIFLGLTLLRLPTALPEAWASAGFRPRTGARWIVGIGLITVSTVFLAIGVTDNLRSSAVYAALVAVGVGYYFARRAALAREGYLMDAALRAAASAEG